jgi:hypothetical protein
MLPLRFTCRPVRCSRREEATPRCTMHSGTIQRRSMLRRDTHETRDVENRRGKPPCAVVVAEAASLETDLPKTRYPSCVQCRRRRTGPPVVPLRPARPLGGCVLLTWRGRRARAKRWGLVPPGSEGNLQLPSWTWVFPRRRGDHRSSLPYGPRILATLHRPLVFQGPVDPGLLAASTTHAPRSARVNQIDQLAMLRRLRIPVPTPAVRAPHVCKQLRPSPIRRRHHHHSRSSWP